MPVKENNSLSDNKKIDESQENLLLDKHIEKDPMCLFEKWHTIAKNDPNVVGANHVSFATATKSGIPSVRIMSLKEYSDNGFVFFTHYKSRKGEEIEKNPNVALVFYWSQFSRSVRIEGTVERVSCCKSDELFRESSYDTQIGTLLCEQSTPIESRSALLCKTNKMKKHYPEGKVPRSPLWGGYIIRPHTIEFWQGQNDSLHDRIRFRRPKEKEPDGVLTHEGENGWVYERLCPP
ncbi:pyridoxine/pyridoxamine 5'-phosphate oxidase-like isoform X2 [Leptinotarsa decemlineata]|uniref:pyridoxine/pyridoxamine 5'-phosphate oxidase-like isoform X2 n=1 Tax=Leptinotarsa decemlineata TaxID=7539 RepID=UPI003D307D37